MLRILGIIIMIILFIAVIIVFALKINHNNQLREEAQEYLPPGRIVEVNDKKLHVYTEGEGDITIVFMAGHGTSNPTLDFKPLWMRMIDDYRIAVVEKPGYGWSETSNSPRDIDTMLEETRKMLELSGEKAPYVLFPHSMSGLEAIYWAQKYPDEVKAIIGLDPCTPETINLIPEPQKIQLYFMYFISRIGLSRFIPESEVGENLPLMKSNEISEEDKDQYLAVFYKSSFSKDMLREINYLKDNAKTVAKNEVPINTPMYFFISDDQETSAMGWKEALSDYLSNITFGKYMQLATGHYVHYDKADIIAEEAKAFLEGIK
ncbi:alpha/beta fold hydrolase [Candidatus Contubernalis alkaliaceticus]|uniref:alpha/beta fold hydrolase n=1 Tax=Candidatus Contubernalis alkaliaceticus TaxID=338645 RepID=UPI001F4BE741|nr:alpha/beta hydrolase [Candidatus Contubernalis alkalaceticus]UNC93206.1 alpha/beta hydrolase [Candidatus Contubernalis alkalaceticus]